LGIYSKSREYTRLQSARRDAIASRENSINTGRSMILDYRMIARLVVKPRFNQPLT
jgi:hypothetical protein